jgi:hypothetical protein
MYLEDFLEDPDVDIDKCFELNAEDRATRLEQILNMAYLESLWR